MKTKNIFLFISVLWAGSISAQSEYRITDDGQYEYLSVRQEAGMVYDESMGTYYKPITLRTFFLETQRKGFLPSQLTYTQFSKMTIAEQRKAVKQPYKNIECSVDHPSEDCIVMEEPKPANSRTVDLSPKCEENGNSKKVSLTTQLILNPGGQNVSNADCEEVNENTGAPVEKKSSPSAVKLMLGKE